MITTCYVCNYFVHKDDPECLNCGTVKPTSKVNFKRAFIIFISTLILVFSISIGMFELNGSSLAFAFFMVFFLTLCLEGILSSLNKITPNSLWSRENVIEQRLEELTVRNMNVNKVLNQINESDSKQLQGVRTKLLSAKEIISNQYERYELQKKKIDLIRVQNNLSPVLFDMQNLNESQIDNGLRALNKAKNQINTLREKVSENIPSEFSKQNLPERDGFVEQLDETEVSYTKMRESLISRQATNALRDITSLSETSNNTNELAHAVETFNVNAEISTFSESFEELEAEYKRLKSEDGINEKFLTE